MNIKKGLILFGLCFSTSGALAEIQYKPLSSQQKQEISSGFSLFRNNLNLEQLESPPAFFIKYSFYIPELSEMFLDSYKDFFIPALQAGIHVFRNTSGIKAYNLCDSTQTSHSLAYHIGLKGKIAYFDLFQPYAELAWAKNFCSKKFSTINSPQKKLKHYFSYGALLSLKIFDKESIYELDQDYGINDIGLQMSCSHYSPENRTINLCELGLHISF